MKTNEKLSTLDKLIAFVNQRPGLDYSNYGDPKSYNAESREITADRKDFYELLVVALRRIDRKELEKQLHEKLNNSPDRLTMDENGILCYTAGQYSCTEYRPAASRVLVSLIWNDYRNEKDAKGEPIYKDGHELRAAIRRNFGRRVNKNYFN